MNFHLEINELLYAGIECPKCSSKLVSKDTNLFCSSCSVDFSQNSEGVWDLRNFEYDTALPLFYENSNYSKWKKIFSETEVNDWAIYRTPARRFFSKAGHRKLGLEISKNLTGGSTLLEIGAGNGALLDELTGVNYIGIDHCIDSLSYLKKNHPKAIAICTSGTRIPFVNNSFDRICSLHVLEHIYFIAEHCEEISRLLRKDGIFHYVIPTEGGLAFWLGRKLITGPHLKKKYSLNIDQIMAREHINDARRVLKFLNFYFGIFESNYWPVNLPLLSINAMIFGKCKFPKHK